MVNESIIHQDLLMLMLFLLLLLNPQSPGFLDELTFSDVASVVTLTTTITAFRRQKNLRKSVNKRLTKHQCLVFSQGVTHRWSFLLFFLEEATINAERYFAMFFVPKVR